MAWEPVGENEPVQPNVPYRSRYYLSIPYTTELAGIITGAVMASKSLLRLTGINVVSAETFSPGTSVDQGTRNPRWEVRINWTPLT